VIIELSNTSLDHTVSSQSIVSYKSKYCSNLGSLIIIHGEMDKPSSYTASIISYENSYAIYLEGDFIITPRDCGILNNTTFEFSKAFEYQTEKDFMEYLVTNCDELQHIGDILKDAELSEINTQNYLDKTRMGRINTTFKYLKQNVI
jgi:hypothetical protein